jgi:methionyl aminopeptidase
MILKTPPEQLIKACKIASKAREYGKGLIVKGASLLEVTQKVERKILELGGSIAFPPQLSLNHIAAHSCPDIDDTYRFGEDVVKLDIGVHIDGYIGDTATTVDLSGKHQKLVAAAEEALLQAIKHANPGTQLTRLGAAIHAAIARHGFSPVRNLSGHGLGEYEIHTSPNIPNYDNGDQTRLQMGQLIAIEPFASEGKGIVQEGTYSTLFSVTQLRPVRLPTTRRILKFIEQNYGNLVFTKRWLKQHFKPFEVEFALRELLKHEILRAYPPLGDAGKGLVAQAEHTIYVANPPIVLTN